MTIKNDDSKLTLYIALGIGAAVAFLITIFGFFLMLGVGVELVPMPADQPGVSVVSPPETNNSSETIIKTGECSDMYSKIDQELQEANHCTDAKDCDNIILGGAYIEFGCYHFINKEVDKGAILQKIDDYTDSGCNKVINDCAIAPEAVCVQNKCVSEEESLTINTTRIKGTTAFVGRGNGIGEKFTIESNFAPEKYSLKISRINYETGLLSLEYDKRYLGRACSSENGTGKLQIPYGIKVCLMSTTCDTGEKVCFENKKVKDGIKIIHTVEKYDDTGI